MKNVRKILVSTLIFSCAAVVSAVIIAAGLTNISPDRRTVSVRGLCEREVPADTAVWPIVYSFGSDSLEELHSVITSAAADVAAFLEKNGLTSDDFTVQAPVITDLSTERYGTDAKWRYIAKNTVLVRTKKISEVKAAVSNSMELMESGIAVSSDYGNSVQFLFTGLNDVKPAMIAAATENAREAAEQFARDSGSRVGKIKTASQGLFSIEDAAPGLSDVKTVRVVTSVQYYLAD